MAFRKLILLAIAKNDGRWGLQQLDRALSPIHPEVESSLRPLLQALERERFIKAIAAPGQGAMPRYSLTSKGRGEVA
jgi:DNA-binding HxlR family transcriptional regulator